MPHKPSRIVLMLPRFSRYGGVEQFGYRLAGELASRGHLVDFICARQEIKPPKGVRVLRTGRPFGPRWLKMLIFACRGEALRQAGNYDCAISLGKTLNQDITRLGGGPLQAFWRLSRKAWEPGLPRMLKQLSRWLQPANWLTMCIEKRMFNRTPCIVPISDSVRLWTEEVYPHLIGAPSSPDADHPERQVVRTIYNCPDTSRFSLPSPEERIEARARLVPNQEAYIMGVATTNFALKGVGQLIESLTHLPEDVHLCVAGGRNPGRYKAAAEKLGVASRVHFCGKVTDMQAFYHGLDLFVLPTFYDTLGNVVLEALACGVRAVCSDRAGAMAFLSEKRILRHPESPEAIADIVLATRSDPEDSPVAVPQNSGIEEFAALVEETLARKRALL